MGRLSLVYFLNLISSRRCSRILLFNCRLKSFFSSHCDHWVCLKYANLTDKIYKRLLIHPIFLANQIGQRSIPPSCRSFFDSTRWTWEAFRCPRASSDKGIPSGMGCLMGEFRSPIKTWQEVAQKYSLFINFQKILKKSLLRFSFSLKWTSLQMMSTRDSFSAQIRSRWDPISGIWDGMGVFSRQILGVVFSAEIGDCKDKSVLPPFSSELMEIILRLS